MKEQKFITKDNFYIKYKNVEYNFRIYRIL